MEWLGVENSKDEVVVNHLGLGLGIPIGLRKALAALVCATLVVPSDAFHSEACRFDRDLGMIVLLLMLAWLCGLLIGARLCSGAAIATDSQSTAGTSSTMTAKAKPKATLRAVGSKGGRNRGKGDVSGDHENPAPPLPDHMDLARPTAMEPEVFVTQFGHKYHRRNDCTGLNGARLVYGPYAACNVCVLRP